MSKNRTLRITRCTAARMLRGAPMVVPDSLADLLAAAAAPPHDGELVGERAAVEAFLETAQHGAAPRTRSRVMSHATLARLLTVKVAAAAAVVLTVGGVATAAVVEHVAPPPGGAVATTSHRTDASPATGVPASARAGSSAAQLATAPPSSVGLCRAYEAGATERGKALADPALADPAFAAVATAAGGRAGVDAYCTALLATTSATEDTGPSTTDATPGRSAPGRQASTDHPTGSPATHPTGRAATHRTEAPTAHPTGDPHPHRAGVATAPARH